MRFAVIVLALFGGVGQAGAQDFEYPAPGSQFETGAGFLEYGLPPAHGRLSVEGQSIGRHALPELSTRALAMSVGWRALRAAAGMSQTGDPELGWTVVAAGFGIAVGRAGFGVRTAARRDRWWLSEDTALGAGVGAEAGVGAWIRPASHVDVWVSAPHVWQRGSAPPIERGLHVGVRTRWSDISAWIEQDTRAPGSSPAVVHRMGVGLEAAPALLWASVRDAPLRATVGITAALSWLSVAAEAESHPVLGETLRLAVQIGGIRERAR